MISIIITILGIFLAIVFGLFLFWRAGRREYLESKSIFDAAAVFGFSFLIFGRIGDFLVRVDYYGWSIRKLVFFNVYFGFDFYFAVLGGVVGSWVYFSQRKEDFWKILDLAASALAFSISFFMFFDFLAKLPNWEAGQKDYRSLFWFIAYFLIFFVLKRLEKQKKHRGFLTSFFIISSSSASLLGNFVFKKELGNYIYFLVINLLIFLAFSVNWYLLSRRRLTTDIKSFFGFFLLLVFRLKRVFTSVKEADNLARSIVTLPFTAIKALYNLVKYLGSELMESFADLLGAFGVSK